MDSSVIIAVLAAVPTILLFAAYKHFFRGPDFAGPKGIPVVGNLVPRDSPWSTLKKWSKEHGPVFGLRVFSTPIVVLNSVEAARELLENRSSIYSNRKPPKMAEMSGLDKGVLFQVDVNGLRLGRKLLATGLQPRELEAYRPVMKDSVTRFLAGIVREPSKWLHHLHRVPTEVSLDIAYGYAMKGDKDTFVERMNQVTRHFESATAFSIEEGYAVNFLPFLSRLPSWLPGMGFKRQANAWKKHFLALAQEGLQMVKDDVARGVARPSVLARGLAAGGYSDDILMRCAPQLFTGGADTIISVTSTFMLTMALNPEIQKRAQAEIDEVIGNDRIPTWADRTSLPYVMSILRECVRWRTPLPTIYRHPVKDDEYEGHFISQKSTVFVNYQGLLRRDEAYPEPDAFKPERWLDPANVSNRDIDPFEIAFGFGRRVCPGKFFAQDLGFQLIVAILTVFRISKARDENGVEIEPKVEYTNGSVVWPLPFQCNIEVRSEHARKLVEHAENAL